MNYRENGIKLVREAKHENIQPFNKQLVEEIKSEINADIKLITDMRDVDREDLENKSKLKLLKTRANQSKRCLMIYLQNRMEKLESITWNLGNILPEQIQKNFDEKDRKYYEQYNHLIKQYSSMLSFSDLDLTKDYAPPKDLYIEVRALENIDNIQTHEGKINVEKNHSYSFRCNDIDHLLRRGLFAINE